MESKVVPQNITVNLKFPVILINLMFIMLIQLKPADQIL